jgi:MFS-type transporter involved in bile tolerance (Atg22 family)
VTGMSLNAAALTWIALMADPDLAYWQLIAPLIVSGAGVAMGIVSTQSAALSAIPPQQIGKASGSYTTMRQLGGAFGLAVVVAVFAEAGSYASPQAFSDGFGAALGTSPPLSLAGAITGLSLRSRRGAVQVAPPAAPAPENS